MVRVFIPNNVQLANVMPKQIKYLKNLRLGFKHFAEL